VAPKLVIFDLDGTLADTLADIAHTMNAVLEGRGYRAHPLEAYRGFVGDGVGMLARRVLSGRDAEIESALVDDFRRIYPDRMLDRTTPFPGIPEMLDALVRGGAGLAVLSNKPEAMTREMCARLFAPWPFEPVWGQVPGRPIKPDPAAALEIARRRDALPADCVFVGDSGVDMATGRAAGMRPVGVLWGFRGREELLEHGAASLAADAGALTELLLG